MRINSMAPQRVRDTPTTLTARGRERRPRRHPATTALLLAVIAGVIGLASSACTKRIGGTPTAASDSRDPSTSDSSTTAPGSGQADGDTTGLAPQDEDGGRATDPGPGGQSDPGDTVGEAPLDPCTVFSWSDFPVDLQPSQPDTAPPTPQQTGDNIPYLAGCLWQGNGVKTLVAWGTPPTMTVEPAGHKDDRLTDINGHRVLYRPSGIVDGSQSCAAFVDLGEGRGTAGLLINTVRAEVDPCATALGLATIIIDRVL